MSTSSAATPTPPVLASTSTSNVLQSFAAGVFATLLTDEEKLVQPVLDGYLGSLAINGSVENADVQTAAFLPAIIAIAPQAESTGIQDTALAIKTFIDTRLPALTAAIGAEAQAKVAG